MSCECGRTSKHKETGEEMGGDGESNGGSAVLFAT